MTAPEGRFDFDAFVSYARLDEDLARRVKDNLEAHGLRVFLDKDDIAAGGASQLETALARHLTRSRSLVVVSSTAENLRRPYVVGEFSAFISFIADDVEDSSRKVATVRGGALRHTELPVLLHGFQSFDDSDHGLASLALLLSADNKPVLDRERVVEGVYRLQTTASYLFVGLALLLVSLLGLYAPPEVRENLPSPVLGVQVDRPILLRVGRGKPGTLRTVTGIVVNSINRHVDGVKAVLEPSGGSKDHVERLAMDGDAEKALDLALVTEGVNDEDVASRAIRTEAPIYRSYVQAVVRRNALEDWLQQGYIPPVDADRPYRRTYEPMSFEDARKAASKEHTISLARVVHALSVDSTGTLLGPKVTKASYQRALTTFSSVVEQSPQTFEELGIIYRSPPSPLSVLSVHATAQVALDGGSLCLGAPPFISCAKTERDDGSECAPVETIGVDFSDVREEDLGYMRTKAVKDAECLKPVSEAIVLPFSNVVLAGRDDLPLSVHQKWQILEALYESREEITAFLAGSRESVHIPDSLDNPAVRTEWLEDPGFQFALDRDIEMLRSSGQPDDPGISPQAVLLGLLALGLGFAGLFWVSRAEKDRSRSRSFMQRLRRT